MVKFLHSLTHTAQVHLKVLQFLTWNMIDFRILGFNSTCYAKVCIEFGLRSCIFPLPLAATNKKKHTTSEIVCCFVCCRMCLWKVVTPFQARFLKQIKKSALLPSCQACSGSSFIAVFLHSFIIISFLFNPPRYHSNMQNHFLPYLRQREYPFIICCVSYIGGSKWQEACIPMFCRCPNTYTIDIAHHITWFV